MKKGLWIIVAFLSVVVGFYPSIYFFLDKRFGLLSNKSEALLQSPVYNTFFFMHIMLGGFALLIGWVQFNATMRNKHMHWHRRIGKMYVSAVLLSAIASLYIAFFATGGIITALGFTALGIIWLSTTLFAYRAIRNLQIAVHQKFMVYSYAACFAAVTLRIWLPLLTMFTRDFFISYKIVSWLCWVPNMVVAYFITKGLGVNVVTPSSVSISNIEKRNTEVSI